MFSNTLSFCWPVAMVNLVFTVVINLALVWIQRIFVKISCLNGWSMEYDCFDQVKIKWDLFNCSTTFLITRINPAICLKLVHIATHNRPRALRTSTELLNHILKNFTYSNPPRVTVFKKCSGYDLIINHHSH